MTKKSFFSQFNPATSLRARLSIGIWLIALVLFVGGSILIGDEISEQVSENKGVLFSDVAQSMARELDKDMYTRSKEVKFFSNMIRVRDPRFTHEQKRELMDDIITNHPGFAWIGIVDSNGVIQVGAKGLLEGIKASQREYFIKGSQGSYAGDIHDAVLLAKHLPPPKSDPLPLRFVDVAHPIYGMHDKAPNGVLVAHMSWEWASEVRDHLLQPVIDKMGSLDVLVFDRAGKLVLGPSELLTGKKTTRLPASIPALKNGATYFLTRDGGESYLYGFAKSTGYADYPGLGWQVVVRQKTAHAFAKAEQLKWATITGSALVSLIFGLLAWLWVGRLTQPVRDIVEVADGISAGNLDLNIPETEGRDERAMLTRSLRNMLAMLNTQRSELASANADLEHKVTERTASLQEAFELNEQILRASSVGIAAYQASGACLFANQALCRIIGATHEQVLALDFRNIDDWQKHGLLEVAEQVLASGEAQSQEFHFTTGFGNEVWLDCFFASFSRGSGHNLLVMVSDISERKQTQKQLELFKLMVEKSAIPTHLLDVDDGFRIVYANEAAERHFGAPREELQSWRAPDWDPDFDMARLAEVTDYLRANPGRTFETRHRVRGGALIPVEVTGTILEIDGRTYSFSYSRDISERKHALAELNRSRDALNRAQEIARIGSWIWDRKTGGLEWSDEIYRILGYQPQEFQANQDAFLASVHPEDLPGLQAAVQHALESHEPYSYEYRIVLPSGEERHVHQRGDMEFNEQGKPVRVVGTLQDITERKKAEEDLELYRLMIEKSGDPIFLIDDDDNCRMAYVNEAAVRHYGAPREEILTWHIPDWDPSFSTEHLPEHVEEVKKIRNLVIETVHRVKGGKLVPVEISLNYVQYKGRSCHFGYFKDISERKQAEQALREAKEAAESANRSKGDFLANMSHEIRTPMNAIIGLSHLCLQTELNRKQQDYLKKVHTSAKSLLGILNDILDFSKIDSGKLEMESIQFELEDVIGNLATISAVRAEEKQIEFLLETALDVPPHLIGDAMRLGQILINLTGNAIKFTEQGEILVQTEVEEETATDAVLRFTVQDSGIGMTAAQIDKLFQSFSQADASITRKYGGTGLGLAISKQLVELMGGTIWVESEPGKGTKFIFTARFRKVLPPVEKNFPLAPDLRGMHVLAVDDNARSRGILRSYLELFSFTVAEAANGAEAIDAVEKAGVPYDLVILDWKMPQLNGIDAARRIRALSGLSKMPKLLLISAFGQSEMRQHLDDNLFDGIMPKPFQQSGLFNAIMDIFGVDRGGGVKRLQMIPDRQMVAQVSGAHLLLVEDNEINQQVARELLERLGISVIVADNGEEALALIAEEKFDGVLMDMQMPVMDGITATREIRKMEHFQTLPIIAMTANAMASDQEKCLSAGMNDYIVKPIDPDRMLATLAKWIVPAQPASAPAADQRQESEALPDLPGVKVAEGVRRMGGKVATYYAVLEKFRRNQAHAIAEMREVLSAGEREKFELLAHTLKGVAGTLGAGDIQKRAGELEDTIREGGEAAVVDPLLPPLELALNSLFAAIDRVLEGRRKAPDKAQAQVGMPLDRAALAPLIIKARTQLEEFDSGAEETAAQMRIAAGGDAAAKAALDRLENCLSAYDYETALNELEQWRQTLDEPKKA